METVELSEKAKNMAVSFKNLVDETNTLKFVLETILVMRAGLLRYAGCKSLDDSLDASETLIKKRAAEIEASLKVLAEEAKKISVFLEELPPAGIQ